MKALGAARSILAFLVGACPPPAVLLWVAIHPYAARGCLAFCPGAGRGERGWEIDRAI
ncbi:MAG: hypothetical protein JXO51_00245 [Candidatus Aminicenantes bacterium]|nr:hypothetical protein [Candidatus Aminicenantes bacterium]